MSTSGPFELEARARGPAAQTARCTLCWPSAARRSGHAASALALFASLWAATPARAQPVIDSPVVDAAGVLGEAEEQAIGARLVEHQRRTGVQLAVLLVDSTEGEPIEDYALDAATAWAGGAAGRDDGALFVLAIRDRRMRLEVGYGLEGVIPDGRARTIIDRSKPQLREQEYAAAIGVVLDGVFAATAGMQPGQAAPLRARAIGLLFSVRQWPVLFFVLGALLCALPHVYRKRYPGESMQAQAQRQDAEKRAREKNPGARSAYDALPWQQRFILNPWSAMGLGIALWFGVPGLIALTLPGVRFWNMTSYLVGGVFGILTAWAWFRGKVWLTRAGVAFTVAWGVALFFALQWTPLGDEFDTPEIVIVVTLLTTAIPFFAIYMAILDTGGGGGGSFGSSRSSARRSASAFSSSSSSSRASGSSSYRGGGGRFGGGGASSSW